MAVSQWVWAWLLLQFVVCSHALSQKEMSDDQKLDDKSEEENSPAKDEVAGQTMQFSASLPAPKKDGPISKILGWQLNFDDEAAPVAISKVKAHGSLADWNAAHPDQAIAPGDRILQVNGVRWQKNSKQFADDIGKEFVASRGRNEGISLVLQRQVHEVANSRAATEEKQQQQQQQQQATIAEVHDAGPPKSNRADEVTHVARKIEGLLRSWNKLHPEDPIDTSSKHFSDALAVLIERGGVTPQQV